MGVGGGGDAVLYWPQRRLHAAQRAKKLQGGGTDKALWLLGFRAAKGALCVVDFAADRAAARDGLEVLGVCFEAVETRGPPPHSRPTDLVVAFATSGSAEAVDRSLRILASGCVTSTIVLYDPPLFERGLGLESIRKDSSLYPPMERLCRHFGSQRSRALRGSTNSVRIAAEWLAYYTILVPFAAANVVWEAVFHVILAAPLLEWLPVGRGVSLKDYSQCLNLLSHRVSTFLSLPSRLRERYRSSRDGAAYTELGDFVVFLAADYALGLFFSSFLASSVLPVAHDMNLTPFSFLDVLRENVVWLMGAPAGFKLNVRLAAILGNGIVMWLDFWEFLLKSAMSSSLGVAASSSPRLLAVALRLWRHAGITLQLSLIADVLWLVTWNSYWVYLYFTKLNAMQLRLLSSLWKLFLGKKNNVLRKRVDSCEYDVNQLLLGTLLFTILVFLVTTNAVFFVFFGIVRLVVWLSTVALWVPIVALRAFPAVSILHRVLCAKQYANSLGLEALDHQPVAVSFTVSDISPSRRRERDATDREDLRSFHVGRTKTCGSVFFRVVTRPSVVGQRFHRLRAYQNQVARSCNGSAIVNSCLFGAAIAPVDASVLFQMSSTTPAIPTGVDTTTKTKVE